MTRVAMERKMPRIGKTTQVISISRTTGPNNSLVSTRFDYFSHTNTQNWFEIIEKSDFCLFFCN